MSDVGSVNLFKDHYVQNSVRLSMDFATSEKSAVATCITLGWIQS
jgi:hypothetical protein